MTESIDLLHDGNSADKPSLSALRGIEEGLFILDFADGPQISDLSLRGAELMGTTPARAIGRPAAEIFPDAVSRELVAAATKARGRSFRIDSPAAKGAGPARVLEWTLHEIAGRSRRFGLLVARDVTARKATEATLKKLSRAVEQSPASVMITDVNGVIEYVNPRFLQVTGYTEAEVLGKTPALLQSGFTSPLVYRDLWQTITRGEDWRGEMLNRRKSGDLFWEHMSISALRDDEGQISHYIAVREDISLRKDYEKRILFQAHYDELTKLPNRILIMDRLNQALARADRNQEYVGVVFLDLDGFKKINDTLGHTYGDDLLRLAAKRLLACLRASDTVGRLGGDEFLVILSDLHKPEHTRIVTDKILKAFETPFSILAHDITTTASLGVTLYPADGRDPAILLRNADAAMYRAKESGRNCCCTFDPDMNTLARRHLHMESLLHSAVPRGEMFLVFQPQIETHSGRLVGAEALARWNSPEFGLVSPAEFIPLAEESGLIDAIGEFVLNAACRQMAEWRPRLPRGFRISVNASTRQVASVCFSGIVAEALKTYDLPAEFLEIELTESLFALHLASVAETLAVLAGMGIRLAVDDFGTGYSSLCYLREFPVNSVKIDRAFMTPVGENAGADALVRAIVAMGHSLKLKVVGEGVETEQQMSFLKDADCDVAQGFLLARPLSAEDFSRLLV